MKQLFFGILCSMLCTTAAAQGLLATAHMGLANYQGDLQQQPYAIAQSKAQLGFSLTYHITPLLGIRGGVHTAHIGADDKKSKTASLRARNLNFENKINEFNFGLVVNTADLEERFLNFYGYVGAAFYTHNPFTYDNAGKKIFLQPLSTEGQGLPEYPTRKQYNLQGWSVPFAGGVQINLSNHITLGYELMMHKTFTDYLDDVSQYYPDFSTLLNRRGAAAVALSYRGYELPGANSIFPPDIEPRGSAKKNSDWYYFQSITISLHLLGKNRGIFGHQNDYKTKCPSVF